jgi:hypothetical protein
MDKPSRSQKVSNKRRVSRRHHQLHQENKGQQEQSKLSLRARFRLLKENKERQVRNHDLHHHKTVEHKGMNQAGEMLLQMVSGAAEMKADQEEFNSNVTLSGLKPTGNMAKSMSPFQDFKTKINLSKNLEG